MRFNLEIIFHCQVWNVLEIWISFVCAVLFALHIIEYNVSTVTLLMRFSFTSFGFFSQKVSDYNCLIEWNSIFILFFSSECIKNETRQNGKCGRFYDRTAWNGIGLNRHKNAWLLFSTFIKMHTVLLWFAMSNDVGHRTSSFCRLPTAVYNYGI